MLLEDDHLGPIAGTPRVTLTAGRRRWAAARSLAKSLGPDLRLAVLAGDPHTINRVRGRQTVGPGWVSHLLQRTAAELLADNDVDRQLDARRPRPTPNAASPSSQPSPTAASRPTPEAA